jgi:hypothetical protein
MLREMETMQQHADEMQGSNSKLEKARKRLQNEVSTDFNWQVSYDVNQKT